VGGVGRDRQYAGELQWPKEGRDRRSTGVSFARCSVAEEAVGATTARRTPHGRNQARSEELDGRKSRFLWVVKLRLGVRQRGGGHQAKIVEDGQAHDLMLVVLGLGGTSHGEGHERPAMRSEHMPAG
jgi:hypothetical protein